MEGLTSIIRNQGWKQLFAGLSINYIKVVSEDYLDIGVSVSPSLCNFAWIFHESIANRVS